MIEGRDLLTSEGITRCSWDPKDTLMIRYHDEEWGRPVRDSRQLFAKLILDGFQAGLSWRTILYRREGFYRAFDGLDPALMAEYGESEVECLLGDAGIIRNKLKVRAAISNAKAFMAYEAAEGSAAFSALLWSFTGGKTKVNYPLTWKQTPTSSPESDAMSKALLKLGFRFVGTTICYAFMQAVGIIDDHIDGCFCKVAIAQGGGTGRNS